MFRRTRLRLTASYAALSFSLLALLIGAAYFALVVTIDQQIDDDLDDSATQLATELAREPLTGAAAPVGTPASARPRSFVLAIDERGVVITNPRNVDRPERLAAFAAATRLRGAPLFDSIVLDGQEYRLYGLAIAARGPGSESVGSGGDTAVVVVSGRDLAFRDARIRLLATVFAVAVLAGLLLSLGAGWLVAGSALEPMQDAYELQQQFVADASHELRSPITVIRTASDLLLRRGNLTAIDSVAVTQIQDTAVDASLMIDDMLTLAQLSAPGGESAPIVVDLAEIAAREIERMRPTLDEHDIQLETALAPAAALSGPRESARIVRALLENAQRHTPPGTVVRVGTRTDGARAVLTVEDNGPGVPSEQLPALFRRFSQISHARTPDGAHGAGLGLAIVAAIAERRGGDTRATRSDLGGLRVDVVLPGSS